MSSLASKDDVGNVSHNRVGLAAPNLAELEVAKRNQDSKKGAAMSDTTPSPLDNAITIDDERRIVHLSTTRPGGASSGADSPAGVNWTQKAEREANIDKTGWCGDPLIVERTLRWRQRMQNGTVIAPDACDPEIIV